MSTGPADWKWLKTLLTHLRDALMLLDEQGFIQEASPGVERLFGYRRSDLIGRHVSDLLADRPCGKAGPSASVMLEQAAALGSAWPLIGRHADGTSVRLQVITQPLLGNGQSGRAVVFQETDASGTPPARLAKPPHAELVLAALGYAVVTTDPAGFVDYLNPAAEKLTGWSLAEACGQPLEKVLPIVDEHGRKRRPVTVAQNLRAGQVIGLPRHSVLISRSGREYGIQHTTAILRNAAGTVLGAVLVFSDVTQARQRVREIAHQAAHDSLTGLVNRREFERRLDRAWQSARENGAQHVLGYLDLDQFKFVNDSCGHGVGDELLKRVGSLLMGKLRARDTLARVGGDEFGLLMENCPTQKARPIAESMVAAVRHFRFNVGGRPFVLGASIGLVAVSRDSEEPCQLLNQADLACYTAKRLGGNRVHVHQTQVGEPGLPSGAASSSVTGLREALENNRFQLFVQPIVALSARAERPLHYELLLRLLSARGTLVSPEAFIPTAERYGLMTAIDRWVIDSALHRAAAVLSGSPHAGIVINLSGTSLNDDSLLPYVQKQLADSAVPPQRVCFEITETAAINNLTQAARLIAAIKTTGCRFALDDFGSGLSSFAYLKHLPVDYLKIDGSFVRDMVEDTADQAIVAAINQVGHIMGIQTIAECVENAAIVEQLRHLGVDYAQGYDIGKPQPLERLAITPP